MKDFGFGNALWGRRRTRGERAGTPNPNPKFFFGRTQKFLSISVKPTFLTVIKSPKLLFDIGFFRRY